MTKIKVGVSACLLGEKVRYDGGHKHHRYIDNILGQFFEFTQFCPEVNIGLGIPRAPIRIVLEGDLENPSQRVVAVADPSKEYTEQLQQSAKEQQYWLKDLCGYIFKKDSPSCGMERVKAFHKDHPTRKGVGAFAQRLMENNPLLPCEEEGRLNDTQLRENFIERVYVYSRWKRLVEAGVKPQGLIQFHSRHKFILLSHNQKRYREIGRMMSNIPREGFEPFAGDYISQVMAVLKKPATRRNHINVLQHLQGYLRPNLDGDDKQELLRSIETCRTKDGPLTVPRTLLRHYFRKFPNEYIAQSYYLKPYPDELGF